MFLGQDVRVSVQTPSPPRPALSPPPPGAAVQQAEETPSRFRRKAGAGGSCGRRDRRLVSVLAEVRKKGSLKWSPSNSEELRKASQNQGSHNKIVT